MVMVNTDGCQFMPISSFYSIWYRIHSYYMSAMNIDILVVDFTYMYVYCSKFRMLIYDAELGSPSIP